MKSTSRNQRVFLFALIAIGVIITVADAKRSGRISGADDAEFGVYTWVAEIALRRYRDDPRHRCGGAIITDRHILTAAHCIDKADIRKYTVSAGIRNLRDSNAVTSNIAEAFLHPKYLPETHGEGLQNDIAILELDRSLKLGGRLTKISLPTSPPRNHQSGIVTGWGYLRHESTVPTLSLQVTNVTFIDDEGCHRWRNAIRPHFFCGLHESGNILGGDSGSPLVSEGAVIGIASSTAATIGIPDLYTNVYDYLDWINLVISIYDQHKNDGENFEHVIVYPSDL